MSSKDSFFALPLAFLDFLAGGGADMGRTGAGCEADLDLVFMVGEGRGSDEEAWRSPCPFLIRRGHASSSLRVWRPLCPPALFGGPHCDRLAGRLSWWGQLESLGAYWGDASPSFHFRARGGPPCSPNSVTFARSRHRSYVTLAGPLPPRSEPAPSFPRPPLAWSST